MRALIPKPATLPAKATTPRATPFSPDLHHLQRTAGNRAVQRSIAGAPLPRELRPSFERRFHRSLEGVRVHTGAQAQATADALGARAYTIGQDIHLGTEGLRTSGAERRDLLAHEVVHTLQQGPRTSANLRVGPHNDAYEGQAERLTHASIENSSIERLPAHAPAIQRSRVATRYGEFEDVQYHDLTDANKTPVGVEMYLRFHPGPAAQADLIGLTQSTAATILGISHQPGLTALRHATSGVGTGHSIDQLEDNVSPLYATNEQGATEPVSLRTQENQKAHAAARGVQGIRYQGLGKHGSRKLVAGNWVTEPAELRDAPFIAGDDPLSDQVFETAALAIAGPQTGTYYGSVQWGWRRDVNGKFERLPLRIASEEVPTTNFLTAAGIWNASRASMGLIATKATTLDDGNKVTHVPRDEPLTPTGKTANSGSYFEATYRSKTGMVAAADVRALTAGAETVDLPVPVVHYVSNPEGTKMMLDAGTLILDPGTRVIASASITPEGDLSGYYEGHVAQGPYTGTHGYFLADDLSIEPRGTR